MKNLLLSLLLAFTLVLISPLSVLADIAPPDQPSGASLLPGEAGTRVRMLAEKVLIDVLWNTQPSSLGQARVTARFTMLNQGDQQEHMAVRFPLTFFGRTGGDPQLGTELKDFTVKVGGRTVDTRQVNYSWEGQPESSWAEFDVTFPHGVEVPVEVSYLQEGSGEYPFISLDYTLESGAGWDGTIGAADLVVRLPYEANPQNVIFDEQIGWSETTPGGVLDGREVRWHFEDFEPDWEHNLQVSLVMPSVWRRVLDEQERISRNPSDGEAWGRLGKVYKEMARLRRGHRADAGGKELYRLSTEAYQKAVEQKPNDAAWHAGFADLLWWHYYYDQSFGEEPDYEELLRAMQAVDRALAIDPAQPKAREIMMEMSYAEPQAVTVQQENYTLAWLTTTPTRRPTATTEAATPTPWPPSLTPAPSLTASPPPILTELPTDTFPTGTLIEAIQPPAVPSPVSALAEPESGTGGLCGGATLLPLAGAIWLGRRKMRHDRQTREG